MYTPSIESLCGKYKTMYPFLRMTGNIVQGSVDQEHWTNLCEIRAEPMQGSIPSPAPAAGDDAAVEALADLIHPLYTPRDNARNQIAAIRAGQIDGIYDAASVKAEQAAMYAAGTRDGVAIGQKGQKEVEDLRAKLELTQRDRAEQQRVAMESEKECEGHRGMVLGLQQTIDQLSADLDYAETKWHEAEKESDNDLAGVQSLAQQLMETSDQLVKQNEELKAKARMLDDAAAMLDTLGVDRQNVDGHHFTVGHRISVLNDEAEREKGLAYAAAQKAEETSTHLSDIIASRDAAIKRLDADLETHQNQWQVVRVIAERDKALADLAAANERAEKAEELQTIAERRRDRSIVSRVADRKAKDEAEADCQKVCEQNVLAWKERDRFRDILMTVCEALEIPRCEDGPCDDANAYTKAIDGFFQDEHVKAIAEQRDAARAEADAAKAEVSALKERAVALPLMFGEPDKGIPADMAHGWKMYDDAIEECTKAIRAAGVKVVES